MGRPKGKSDGSLRTRRTIEQIILDDFYNAVGEAAQELTFEIQEAYEKSVDEFYKAYNPCLYKRTENTYRASDHFNQSWVEKESQKTSYGYLAGITISSNYIKPNGGEEYIGGLMSIHERYDDVMDFVFGRSFKKGIHGFNSHDVSLVNRGQTRANEWHPKRIPQNSTPIQTMMNKYYKEIKNKKHIDSLIFGASVYKKKK